MLTAHGLQGLVAFTVAAFCMMVWMLIQFRSLQGKVLAVYGCALMLALSVGGCADGIPGNIRVSGPHTSAANAPVCVVVGDTMYCNAPLPTPTRDA